MKTTGHAGRTHDALTNRKHRCKKLSSARSDSLIRREKKYGNSLLFAHEFSRGPAVDWSFRHGAGRAGVRSRAAEKDRGAADPVGRICRAHSRRVRTIAGVLLRQTSQLRPNARLARNRFPEALLERTASNSLRRNTFVCRDRASCRQSEELSRRWTGEPLQSDRDLGIRTCFAV